MAQKLHTNIVVPGNKNGPVFRHELGMSEIRIKKHQKGGSA